MTSTAPSTAIPQLNIAEIESTRAALNDLLDATRTGAASSRSERLLSALQTASKSAAEQYSNTTSRSVYAREKMSEISSTASNLHTTLSVMSEQYPESKNIRFRASRYSLSRLAEWWRLRPMRKCEEESRTFLTETIPDKIGSCAWHLRSQSSALMPTLQEQMQGSLTSTHCIQEQDKLIQLVEKCEVR